MLEGILMAIAIFIGIPAAFTVMFWGITEYYDRQIIRESRMSDPYGKVEA